MQHVVLILFVVVTYLALAALSAMVAIAPTDAWTVWLASGIALGVLLATSIARWPVVLAGALIGAALFALWLGSPWLEALGYGVIEVVAAFAGAYFTSRFTGLPARLELPRDLAALVLAGALPLSIVGAVLATAWHMVSGGTQAASTFGIWFVANFVGTVLIAPLIIAWAAFRPKRSGGLAMPAFAAGAAACALYVISMHLLFDNHFQRAGVIAHIGLTYVPMVFMALTALLWGVRGATLAAFLGAVIAIINTAQQEGPFANANGIVAEGELQVQGYAVALALTGLLIAVLAASQRAAMQRARDWRTRFETAIDAHRMLAYEWDPASGRMAVTGDTLHLLGVPSSALATLADWLALVAGDERDGIAARFEARRDGQGTGDSVAYRVRGNADNVVEVTDEARAVRDHDGALHRVVGIVRIVPATAA